MIAQVVDTTLFVLILLIIGRSIMSWFNLDPRNPIAEFLITVTEPILAPLRSVIPRMGMFDLTPMAAVFMLILLRSFARTVLVDV